ncbi:restriction endonuclease subunit S [Rhodanobacter umsongensis]|uniref:Restriction endonuclease subunit S n=1 Tax=Rhodanobacter umsongensis TaxID=633153 RepID=A0ABW0JH96_9GAMM
MNIAAQLEHDEMNFGNGEWFGLIPVDWDRRKLKYVVKILKRVAGFEGPSVLSITQRGIKIKDTESGEGQLAQDYSGYQLVDRGDFAMNHMDLLTGYVDISQFDGVVSPDYRVFRNFSADVSDEYLLLIFQIGYTQKIFFRYGQGVSLLGRWRLPADNFNEFAIPIPPMDQQRKIVTFLKCKVETIDEAVRIKQEQIKLLRERRKILIQQVVTRGLNPNAPMKDSGIDWIGQIPAHWEVVPILAVGEVIDPNPSHRNPEYVDDGFPFISTQEFRPGAAVELNTPRRVSRKTVEEQEERCRFTDGSLVFSRKGTIGAVRVLPAGIRLGILDSLCVINPNRRIDPTYMFWTLSSDYLSAQYGPTLRGAALPQLSVGRVRSLKIILPPKAEQLSLIEHLVFQTSTIDRAISIKEDQITALKEYKTTLINAAVTGKIKVIQGGS